jgi:hypothetical protein
MKLLRGKKLPTLIFVQKGVYEIKGRNDPPAVRRIIIDYPMVIVGAGQDKSFVKGTGFRIEGTKEKGKKVVLKDMTISETSRHGLFASDGLSFLCKDMTFTQCGDCGVLASNTKGRLINCVITQCGRSGIICHENALIELKGSQTKVHGNVAGGGNSSSYGLRTNGVQSIIHLLFPLTKESVSTTNNNRRGTCRNYGGVGTIETVKELSSIFQIMTRCSRSIGGKWMEHTDVVTGRQYYVNNKTQESTWTWPEGILEPGWQEVFDPISNNYFYCHRQTRETSWTKPGSVVSCWKEYTDPDSGRKYYVNSTTSETTWVKPTSMEMGVEKIK